MVPVVDHSMLTSLAVPAVFAHPDDRNRGGSVVGVEGEPTVEMTLNLDGYTDLPPGKIASVVTYLEMLERAPERPGVAEPGFEVRRVEGPTVDWYVDLFRRVGGPWLWWGRLSEPREELQRILRDPGNEIFELWAGDRAEGLLELDRRDPSNVELLYFGVTPEMVGRGGGRMLMDFAIARVWDGGARRFWLHTCTLDHPGAVDFYVRSGFKPFRRGLEIAADPRLCGLLPVDAAPGVPLL